MHKLIEYGITQYGFEEVVGKEDNPEIIKYFTEMGFKPEQLSDETAWCSAVINYLCKKAGLPYTGKLNARSWLDVGMPVNHPAPGDIVVFWRGKSKDETIAGTNLKKGHVGIYINQVDDLIYTMGGNQSNMFNISPYSSARLLGYRRL